MTSAARVVGEVVAVEVRNRILSAAKVVGEIAAAVRNSLVCLFNHLF